MKLNYDFERKKYDLQCSEKEYYWLVNYIMATYKMCKKCKRVVEMIKETNSDFGYDTTVYKCPECDNIEKHQINTVHYGNDGLK